MLHSCAAVSHSVSYRYGGSHGDQHLCRYTDSSAHRDADLTTDTNRCPHLDASSNGDAPTYAHLNTATATHTHRSCWRCWRDRELQTLHPFRLGASSFGLQ